MASFGFFCVGVVRVSSGASVRGEKGGGVSGARRRDGDIVAGACSSLTLRNASEYACSSSVESNERGS